MVRELYLLFLFRLSSSPNLGNGVTFGVRLLERCRITRKQALSRSFFQLLKTRTRPKIHFFEIAGNTSTQKGWKSERLAQIEPRANVATGKLKDFFQTSILRHPPFSMCSSDAVDIPATKETSIHCSLRQKSNKRS